METVLHTAQARREPAGSVGAMDPESEAWLEALRSSGARRDEAIARLHELMVRAARFEVRRRRGALTYLGEEELDVLAMHAADDALVALLGKLGDYEGRSRFTTWAVKFALLEAGVKVQRRRMWRRDVALEPAEWERRAAAVLATSYQAELGELLRAVGAAIRADLTPHQRRVLLALAVEGVPIDVLAAELSTTRGALYKTVHDARRKLRAVLAVRGIDLASALGEEPDGA